MAALNKQNVNYNNINSVLVKKLFPSAKYELFKGGAGNVKNGKVYYISRHDMDHLGINKMGASIFRFISRETLEKYFGEQPKSLDDLEVVNVVYVLRNGMMVLKKSLENKLLSKLDNYERVNLKVVSWEKMSFQEQIETA